MLECYGCGSEDVHVFMYDRWSCWDCHRDYCDTMIELAEWEEQNDLPEM